MISVQTDSMVRDDKQKGGAGRVCRHIMGQFVCGGEKNG